MQRTARPYHSFGKFYLDWNVDVAVIMCVGQKFADSRASSLTIISSKLIHVHADELTGKFRVHIARVASEWRTASSRCARP